MEIEPTELHQRVPFFCGSKKMVEKAEEELTKSGIELHLKSKIISLKGKQFVEDIVLEKGQVIHLNSLDKCSTAEQEHANAGLVVFAVGMKPNTEIFQNTDEKGTQSGC